jgi:GcrA cell cycle regulator
MASRLWTTERIGAVQRLWADGKTAVEIAAVLDGVSRSAVLGMIFRLRLGADGKTAPANASKPSKPGKSRAAVAPLPPSRRHRRKRKSPVDPPPRRSGPLGLFELTNEMCRWPHGQLGGRNYLFCAATGADLSGGVPYCALHMRRAYLIPPRAASAKAGKINNTNRMSNSGSSACVPGRNPTALPTKSPARAPS